jgi:hypothetical protein
MLSQTVCSWVGQQIIIRYLVCGRLSADEICCAGNDYMVESIIGKKGFHQLALKVSG